MQHFVPDVYIVISLMYYDSSCLQFTQHVPYLYDIVQEISILGLL